MFFNVSKLEIYLVFSKYQIARHNLAKYSFLLIFMQILRPSFLSNTSLLRSAITGTHCHHSTLSELFMGIKKSKEISKGPPAPPTTLPTGTNVSNQDGEVATFGAGCFWSVELAFQRLPGVLSTRVGYTQGKILSPTYEQVCSGTTGHVEAVEVTFDPTALAYPDVLSTFWKIHNPTTLNRQKNDCGTQYRSGIYVHSKDQLAQAQASKTQQQATFKDTIVTEIKEAEVFYPYVILLGVNNCSMNSQYFLPIL